MVLRSALAALTFYHTLGMTNSAASLSSLCAQRSRELDCESEVGCYWATWRAVPECLARPLSNSDCFCTIASGCGDPFMNGFLNLSWDGPSGCQPTRFCRFKLTTCQVQLDLSSDSAACAEDGQNTMSCVPSEFCTKRAGSPTSNLTFTNSDCVLKPQGSFTLFPTPQPTLFVPPPSSPAPVASPPSVASDGSSSSSAVLLPLAAGAGAAVALGVVVIAGFSYRRRRSEDTAQLAALAMAANAVRTAAQMQREEVRDEELQRNAGVAPFNAGPRQQAQRRDRDEVPDF
jgi:hypothetical protein